MHKIAFLFPGQGSQYPGMGKDVYDLNKNLFEKAEKIKSEITNLCLYGAEEELKETINTQPAMFMVETILAYELINNKIIPEYLAGFSLGEISALTVSNAFNFEEGFKLVCKRAEFMNDATKQADAGMIAVLKLSKEEVEEICSKFKQMYPVNYNCPGQIVVSGLKTDLDKFSDEVKKAGGKSRILKVSGGFHSPFMNEASVNIKKELENYNIKEPGISVYSNYTAKLYDKNIKNLIEKQINNPVLWEKIIRDMLNKGIETFVEVGPGKVISGFINKISDKANVINVHDKETLYNAMNVLR